MKLLITVKYMVTNVKIVPCKKLPKFKINGQNIGVNNSPDMDFIGSAQHHLRIKI